MNGSYFAAAAALAASLWTWAAPVAAQDGTTPVGHAPGAPVGSYPLGDLDHVNLFGGSLSFRLPLMTVQGRGEAAYQPFLVIEQHWGLVPVNQFQYEPRFNWFRNVPPGYSPGAVTQWQDISGVFPEALYLTRLTFTAADHTQHELRDVLTEGRPRALNFNRGRVFKSFDGSNLTFVTDDDVIELNGTGSGGASGRLFFPDGVEYRFGADRHLRDRNGNALRFEFQQFELSRVTDSLNRQVNFTNVGPNSPEHVISFKGFGGAPREVRVTHGAMGSALVEGESLQTLAQLFPTISWSAPDLVHEPFVATAAILPDGRAYSFRYNSYGELAEVQLPTGGVFRYAYVTAGVSTEWIYRRLSQKSVYSGGTEVMRTTFEVTAGPPEWNQITTVRHYDPSSPASPFASERHHFFSLAQNYLGPSPPATYNPWRPGREFRTEFLDGAGVVRKLVEHAWEQYADVPWPVPDPDVPHDPRLVETVTTLDGVAARVTYTHDVVNNHYFNLTDVREYDFDGALKRRKQTVFDYSPGYFDPPVHLRQIPLLDRVWDGEGVVRAETAYEHDNYAGGLLGRANLTGRLSPDPYGPEFTRRGNRTKVRRWLDTTGGYLETRFDYDVAGNVTRETSPRGFSTVLEYDDRFGAPGDGAQGNTRPPELPAPSRTWAFASSTVNPLSHRVYDQRDYYTSQVVDHEDANGVLSSAWFDDPFARPTVIVAAGGLEAHKSRTWHEYVDGQRKVITRRDKDHFQDNAIRTERHHDDLGREVETRTIEPGGGYVAVQSEYDAKGRLRGVSNPYRPGSEQAQWTVTEYDALDRVTSVIAPGTAETTTEHFADTATVTDPGGKSRRSRVDALGRLVEVVEDPGSLDQLTSYRYDVLDNLEEVGTNHLPPQVRRFDYDSLSRLTLAVNPESGTATYTYDANGNPRERRDARGIVTTYDHDALDRLRTITYTNEPPGSETPDVANTYDDAAVPRSKGRLTRVQSSAAITDVLAYDPLGRVTQSRQTTAGQAYGIHYGYDRAGHLVSQTYPSGRVVTTTFDRAERVDTVTSRPFQGTDRPYADHLRYAAHGAPLAFRLGNGRWDLTTYNERLQPRYMGLNSVDSSGSLRDIVQIENRYGDPSENNGNVTQQLITAPGFARTQTYSYDPMNRMRTAVEAGSWSQTYDYDRFGNRAVTGTVPEPALSPSLLSHFSTATNRINTTFDPDIQYDASGNLTRDSRGWTYAYDAENRQASAQTGAGLTTYGYDGEGRRVRRVQGTVATTFVYDAGGRLLADYGGPGPTLTSFITRDHLGTTRLVTDAAGAVRSRHDHFPFGEEIPASLGGRVDVPGYGAQVGVRQKFTGKERDFETGLDFFQARYFSGPQGRFTSPDPGNAGASPSHPQSWNGYVYALDNPLRYVDPDGRAVRICGVDGECLDDYSDAAFKKNFLDDRSISIQGSQIYKNGVLIGSAQRTSFDDLSPFANAFFVRMSAQREATKQMIGVLAGGSTVVGVSGGAIAVVGGAAGGSSVTTLGLQAGPVVLGSYPAYTNLASRLSGHAFTMPKAAWDGLTSAEQWAANKAFLDRAIAAGREIVLSNSGHSPRPGSFFAKEVAYLQSRGYQLSADGLRMFRP